MINEYHGKIPDASIRLVELLDEFEEETYLDLMKFLENKISKLEERLKENTCSNKCKRAVYCNIIAIMNVWHKVVSNFNTTPNIQLPIRHSLELYYKNQLKEIQALIEKENNGK